ncbi:MAG: hypothetical protein IPH75_06465 [bacterium]|nr:hypothetical protein [bacterium]
MTNRVLSRVIILLFILFHSVCGMDGAQKPVNVRLLDTASISAKIESYVFPDGNPEFSLSDATITRGTYSDSTLPFLSSAVFGRLVIRTQDVHFKVMRREQINGDSVTFTSHYGFEAIVDELSGNLMQFHHAATCSDCVIPPNPPVADAERQLWMGFERYWGFPAEAPVIGLAQILGGDFVVAVPSDMLDLTAQYLLYGRDSTDAVPAWVVTLKGVNLSSMVGIGARTTQPPGQLSVLRTVFSALDGRVLRCNNRPHMPDEWRPQDSTLK